MIPWALYNLTPRDQAGPLLRPLHERQSTTFAAVVAGSHIFTLPDEGMFLLTNVSIVVENGSGLWNGLRWAIFDPSGGNHGVWRVDRPTIFANNDGGNSWGGSPLAVVPGGWQIITYYYSALSNHDMISTVTGVLIPRGTMAYV